MTEQEEHSGCTFAWCDEPSSVVVRIVDSHSSVYPVCRKHADILLSTSDYEELDETTGLWVWKERA